MVYLCQKQEWKHDPLLHTIGLVELFHIIQLNVLNLCKASCLQRYKCLHNPFIIIAFYFHF